MVHTVEHRRQRKVRKPGEKLIQDPKKSIFVSDEVFNKQLNINVKPKEKLKASSVRLPKVNARNKAVKKNEVLEVWGDMTPRQEKKPLKKEASSLRKPGQNDPKRLKPVAEKKVKRRTEYDPKGFKPLEVVGMGEGQDRKPIKKIEKKPIKKIEKKPIFVSDAVLNKAMGINTEKSKPTADAVKKHANEFSGVTKASTKKIVEPERDFTFDDMMGARNQLKKFTKAPAPLIVDNFSKLRKKGNISGTKTPDPVMGVNDSSLDIPPETMKQGQSAKPARKPPKKFLDAQIENSSGMMEDNPFPVIELEQDGRTKKNKLGRKIDKALFGWMK